MALLIDNDVVHKLCQLDLQDEAIPLLKGKYGSLLVLNTLKFKFIPSNQAKRKRIEKLYTSIVISRIESFVRSSDVGEFSTEVSDSVLLEILSESDDNLDAGEMQLLQGIIDNSESMMLTGDKRFLKTLGSSKKIVFHIEKIKHSFICFEQLILFLIDSEGFDYVKKKFLNALQGNIKVDTTLMHCFEGRELAMEERVVDNLSLNIGYIEKEGSGFLLYQCS
ncbi:MAG: hypothetical protein D3910_09115 [Candidatus Electrothrix sp. ATG2]|nr:hypothetical protein [Candidatus Electrothrix sp. ATG2]